MPFISQISRKKIWFLFLRRKQLPYNHFLAHDFLCNPLTKHTSDFKWNKIYLFGVLQTRLQIFSIIQDGMVVAAKVSVKKCGQREREKRSQMVSVDNICYLPLCSGFVGFHSDFRKFRPHTKARKKDPENLRSLFFVCCHYMDALQ